MLPVLTEDDGDPVVVENESARGDVLLVCEHASNAMPRSFGTLGLSDAALASHIAWDPGALAVAKLLSAKLDAALIHQRFSRLIYDCNRPPESPAAMPAKSEIFEIPGNADISQEEHDARTAAIYLPFRDRIAAFVSARRKARRPCVLVTIHSFTPVYNGVQRAVEIGILHDSDKRMADRLLANGTEDGRYDMRRNEPYGPADGVTHTLIEHGIKTAQYNVMIEVRNDLIADSEGQAVVAEYLGDLLRRSLSDLARAQR